MVTTVGKALQKVKLSIPLNQRVWQWTFDHKEQTSKEIAVALKEAQGNVSSVLGDMVARKMMVVVKRQSAHKGGPVGYYSTVAKMKSYKLLPKPKKEPAVVEVPELAPEPVAVPNKPSLDTLSVKEAFELYKELHVMFGPKAT